MIEADQAGNNDFDPATPVQQTLLVLPVGGELDPNFGNAGQALGPSGSIGGAQAIAVQPNGRILVASTTVSSTTGRSVATLTRFNKDGSLDTSFGDDGVVTSNFGMTIGEGTSVALQSNGDIVLAGDGRTLASNDGGIFQVSDFAVARFTSNGALSIQHSETTG